MAWEAAAHAIVVCELLPQRVRTLRLVAEPRSRNGLRETDEEALAPMLLEAGIRGGGGLPPNSPTLRGFLAPAAASRCTLQTIRSRRTDFVRTPSFGLADIEMRYNDGGKCVYRPFPAGGISFVWF